MEEMQWKTVWEDRERPEGSGHARKGPGLPAPGWRWKKGEAQMRFSLRAVRTSRPHQHLDFGSLAFSLGRESAYAVRSHQVMVTCYSSPGK